MRRAREAGYFVRLIHVKVSLETAIRRQKKRHRQVPKEVMKRYQEKIDRALRFEIPLADEYLMVDNNKDDGLTDEQRWGTSIANDIVEQERVYDSIWMSIAEDAYRKSHRKAQEQGQNPDSDLSSLDIPPWLRREVSGFCDDPIYIPPHHVLIDAEKNEEERDEPFCP
uniref:Zeta toxin domain-containing protein n=1 Tax=Amorphochlora amoebiformis TaxID=1561963 RepID=A0A7S0DS55_9EUKA|mmetsp:Transcript_4335/g.6591  ORF Transcript_4335/g.6591 Transcript_4335/m.6591 type:complete len:168 (+) Transcript_4335:2-505(+)